MSAPDGTPPAYDLVVPTLGRPSLLALLRALADGAGPAPGRLILVDDRRDRSTPLLPAGAPAALAARLRLVPGRAAGPASARNLGWRAARAEWIAFLDDDVVPAPDWPACLARDLAALGPDVAGSQGRLVVPRPKGRRPTDWERTVAGLAHGRWITADMAYRRAVLEAVGGFDERFPRAYREDADLALRVRAAGYRLVRGARRATHPVRPADRWVSVRQQAGNADDVLMRALHGPAWRAAAGVPRGRRRAHLLVTASALLAVGLALGGRRRAAALAAAGWLAGTAEFAWARIAPGPRTADEVVTMALTSAVIPAAATVHWLRGRARLRARLADAWAAPKPAARPARAPAAAGAGGGDGGRIAAASRPAPPDAVFFDRDGTLVVDVPYNGDPARVRVVPGAREALERLVAAGVRVAVVSNQSGVARGLLTGEQVEAVNRRVRELLGPVGARVGPWLVCPHAVDDGCDCRKPAPGLLWRAARALGVDPRRCAMIGDTGADVEAARRAGARAILVPNGVTRREEIAAAPEVAPDLGRAVDLLFAPADGGDHGRRADRAA